MKFKVQDFVFNSCMIFEREIFSSQFHQHIMNKSQIIESKGNLTVSPEVQLNQQHTHTHADLQSPPRPRVTYACSCATPQGGVRAFD